MHRTYQRTDECIGVGGTAVVMRVTTLRAGAGGAGAMIAYYEGLALDQQRRDGASRGPGDYYVDRHEPPGRWWGRGCDDVGLSGEVAPKELRALLEARHPQSGRALGRRFGGTSARGFDATFSAPKSVSVLWALSDAPWVRAEALAAHDAAVTAALEWFENHGAVTRRGKDGVDQVDTQGLTVALFRQHTSRSADPQLHTHSVISSKVQDATGKWLSLDARFLKQQQRSISFVYAAALRAELTARLGVRWGPVVTGHAELEAVPDATMRLFSKRSEQVEAKLTELLSRWVAEHQGADPDPRTIATLTRRAVLASRPGKEPVIDGEVLRAEWLDEARRAGLGPVSLPTGPRRLPRPEGWDTESLVAEALDRVASSSATWLRADLAREIAALMPPDACASSTELVAVVDELADHAAARCVELHPSVLGHATRRSDGRPFSEHVTNRRLTTRSVLHQETRLIAWASAAVGAADSPTDDGQMAAVAAASGEDRLVLVVGPAGTGKTTMLATAVQGMAAQGRTTVGLAPSGRAADVLARETGAPAITVAKLLHEQARPDGASPPRQFPPGTTVILDEAGMAGSEDLERLIALVDQHQWRLVCVGDPHQLPAVGRGGIFAQWCDTLPAHHLDDVRRFRDEWQAEASLALRRGDTAAAKVYAAHGRLRTAHPALLADKVARKYETLSGRGDTVAITTSSAGTSRAINVEIQRRRNPARVGRCVPLADGTKAFTDDRIATRRNDPALVTGDGASVRNRQTWTVVAVHKDGSLRVVDDDGQVVVLPAVYVDRHVELGWAVTGYGSQGVTVDHGICVVESSSSRAAIYVGMTRGRDRNLAWITDPTGLMDAEEALTAAIARPARALTAHAVRDQLYEAQGEVVELDAAELMAQRLARAPTKKPPACRLVR